MGWAYNAEPEFNPNCKILIPRPLPEVRAEFQPEIGKIYDAEYVEPRPKMKGFCMILVNGKRLIVRNGEYVRMD